MTDRVLDLSEASGKPERSQFAFVYPLRTRRAGLRFSLGPRRGDRFAPSSSIHPRGAVRLAMAGALFVTCDEKHLPVSMLLPLVTHSLQPSVSRRRRGFPFRCASGSGSKSPAPNSVSGPAAGAKDRGPDHGLPDWPRKFARATPQISKLAPRASTGRPYSARLSFHRDRELEGINACLNYGYAVLRAIVARAICGAGLHPSLSLHHHNRL